MVKPLLAIAAAIALVLPLSACTQSTDGPAMRTVGASTARASTSPIVIAISVDGLNPTAIRQLGAELPTYRRLMRYGSSTLNARTAYELTDTLPNHTGMMTGRPIRNAPGHHVTFNNDRPDSWLAKVAGHYVRGMFDIAHDRGVPTALYVSKNKFNFLDRSWNRTHGAVDRVGANNSRDKITTYVNATPGTLATRLIDQLTTSPRRMTFWHISTPDTAGHQYGFMSAAYLDAVRHSDRLIGRLVAALGRRPALKRRVTIILTADHGGRGPSHRDPTKIDNYRIPFIAWGHGVAVGRSLYAMNPARKIPGTTRPTYAGRQPIRNTDIANLATSLLGKPAVVSFSNRATLHVR